MAHERIDWTKRPVTCADCGASLLRRLFRPKDNRRIERFFCDNACKGRWQTRQHPVCDEWLRLKYEVEKLSAVDIAAIVGRDPKSVWTWLRNKTYSHELLPEKKGSASRMAEITDLKVKCDGGKVGRSYTMIHGDCVSVLSQMPDACLGFSVYSPPFGGSLFVYSDSSADMGNCTDDEFADHYAWLVREKFRVTMPGRLTAVHCSDLPMTKWKDGAVGIKDFSGQIIRVHEEAGWIYHGRRTIWKSPVTEMTRTKHVGLLYKQLQKDSSKSRGGLPDYLMTFIKPGDNPEPIKHTPKDFPLDQWQEWASPVWMSIDQSNVLNVRLAREQRDERHLCPLQLDVSERAVVLWSNPNDIVLSPFAGIGSEGVSSLKLKRRFLGVELKEAYFKHACRYLDAQDRQDDLFERECVA